MNTNELIASLSHGTPRKSLAVPAHYALRLGVVLALYTFGTQMFLGFRDDLVLQLIRPMFLIEITLLTLLIITSVTAAVLSMYPDGFQKHATLKVPHGVFCVLVVFVLTQLGMPHDAMRVIPTKLDTHEMECAICIASVAIIPSAMIFGLLLNGASVRPFHSGSFAVLAASGIGCLTLRLSEANDGMLHLISWHYVPTLLFAILGATVGKWLLKW